MAHGQTEEQAAISSHRDRRRHLVQRIDTILIAARREGGHHSALIGKLTQLRASLLLYFRETERLLATIGMPGLEAFVVVHARLLHEYELHVRRFSAGRRALGMDFTEFLRLWLRLHILHAHPATDRAGKAARATLSRSQQSLH